MESNDTLRRKRQPAGGSVGETGTTPQRRSISSGTQQTQQGGGSGTYPYGTGSGRYTYDDFLSAAGSAGLLGEFSQADLDTAMKYPEFGLSILSLKKDYNNATTDEQRLLANQAANQLRSSYGNYKGGGDGSSFVSQGKIPGQIDDVLDQIYNFGSFSFDQEAPVYDNQYAQQQQALLDAILNREDFSWSKETDPQWSSYKKSYLREGDRATANALAQASAASGGRASTAAVTAASQAGDYYAAQLNDIIPTLYQQAYDRYLNEYSMMLQDLGAVNTQEQLDYQKYLDNLAQYNTDRNFNYEKYLNDFNLLQGQLSSLQGQDAVDYNRYMDEINLDMQREQQAYDRAWNEDERDYNRLWNEELRDYNRGQDAQSLAQAQIDAILASGGTPSADLIAASGYSNEYVQALEAAYRREMAGSPSTGSGSSSGSGGSRSSGGSRTGYDNGNLTTTQIKQMQTALGVEADGFWGPASQAAAGGLGADEAWAIMAGSSGGSGTDGDSVGLDDLNTESVLSLGIGPVSFSTVEQLVEEGKVEVYQDRGKVGVRWVNGYNADNYNNTNTWKFPFQ